MGRGLCEPRPGGGPALRGGRAARWPPPSAPPSAPPSVLFAEGGAEGGGEGGAPRDNGFSQLESIVPEPDRAFSVWQVQL